MIRLKRHYCRMLLTRHYDQRPFDETVCDAIIANGGVKNRQKRCKTFAMAEPSNTFKILVACAMQGIRFSSINCLRLGGTKETGSQMEVCAMHTVHSDELFVIRQHKRNGRPDQGVCDIRHAVHSDELFALRQENINGST